MSKNSNRRKRQTTAIRRRKCKRYNIDPGNVIRPFWPGGDYEKDEYPSGCVVVDNPPFSILKNICEFYLERGIPFFLFAPSLTALTGKTIWNRMNHIMCDCTIVYENGATVKTSFVTSFEPETAAETSPDLTKLVNDTVEKLKQEKARKLSTPTVYCISTYIHKRTC